MSVEENEAFSDEENNIETLRQRNRRERDEFLSSWKLKTDINEALKCIVRPESLDKPKRTKSFSGKKRGDSVFRFTGAIPAQRRWSIRLNHKRPDYADNDAAPKNSINSSSDSLDDLEDVVFAVKKKRTSAPRLAPRKIIPVEEVTEQMLSDIYVRGQKIYSDSGSSCHQCRQKTKDTKTICRSGFCVGVRGQFCGICVINRYGEDPHKALKDPTWTCYVCRGICNCSFCRSKEGKRPTGILTPTALKYGFKSVKEYLDSLRGYGDYAVPENDPNNLLGFRDDQTAVMGGNKEVYFECSQCYIKRENNSKFLLGFKDGCAVMGGQTEVPIDCQVCKSMQQ